MRSQFDALVLSVQRGVAWAPDWAVTLAIVAAFALVGLLLHGLIFGLLRRLVLRRDAFWRTVVHRAGLKLRAGVLLLAITLGVAVGPLDAAPSNDVRLWLRFAFVLWLGWLALGMLDAWATLYLRRFQLDAEDNLLARKHVTQTRILRQTAAVLIACIALGLALITIPGVRQWGVSLLASAGAAGIIAGLALQPLLTNLIAGVQIATTQPIRIDDQVVVEKENGRVEEITGSYVVVRLWDRRRMVLPLTYFIQKPFENWTRGGDTSLIGVVLLHLDYRAAIEPLRAAFETIVHASPLWDGDVAALQVVEATDKAVQVRALVSARNAGVLFDLRCEVRERLIAWLQANDPDALPGGPQLVVQSPEPAAKTGG